MIPSEFHLNRRSFLTKSGTAAAAMGVGGTWPNFLHAQAPERSVDHTIRIGPISLELEHVPSGLNREDSPGAVYEGFYRH
jgi:hypothetical protein